VRVGHTIECDFSEEEFASIGKLIWAFCVFENELARSAMWLWYNHEHTSDVAGNDMAVTKVVEGTMRTRFKSFLKLAKRYFSPADFPLLLLLEERFDSLELTRNRICHGKWHRSNDGKIAFLFYDRKSTGNKLVPDPFALNPQEILQCLGEVLAATAFISRGAGTLNADLANPFTSN
jgi:hypothetical protein